LSIKFVEKVKNAGIHLFTRNIPIGDKKQLISIYFLPKGKKYNERIMVLIEKKRGGKTIGMENVWFSTNYATELKNFASAIIAAYKILTIKF